MSDRGSAADARARLTAVMNRLGASLEASVAPDGRLLVDGVEIPPVAGVYPDWLLEAVVLRALSPQHVLFLCVANSARSQLAEGIARTLAPPGVTVSSAGSEPTSVRPQAVETLREIGIDISGHTSTGTADVGDGVDAVITLCAEEVCPVWLGSAWRVHWGLPDPAGAGDSPEEELEAFRRIRDELRVRLGVLFGTLSP